MSDPLPPHFVPWRSTSTPPPEFWLEPPDEDDVSEDETSLDLWGAVGRERPWATALFLLAWSSTFAAMRLVHGKSVSTMDFLHWGGLPSVAIATPDAWRWLAYTNLHSGVAHLFSNALVMIVLGAAVERIFTRTHMILTFAIGGVAGALGTLLWQSWTEPSQRVVTVGASAAVFALGSALLVGALRLRKRLAPSRARALAASVLWLVVPGIAAGFSKPNVGNAAHIAGFLAGLVCGWALGLDPRLGERPPARLTRALGAGAVAALLVCYVIGVISGTR